MAARFGQHDCPTFLSHLIGIFDAIIENRSKIMRILLELAKIQKPGNVDRYVEDEMVQRSSRPPADERAGRC